jgi:phosphoribosylformylglycinamidine synthase II
MEGEPMKSEPEITPELVAEHGLSPEEYERVLKILGRVPTFTELGIFSVMWSEHCSYKSSKVHLQKLPVSGPRIVQGPGENAGIIDIGDGLVAVFKMESHNHPSFIEPFQGAATGVGGILRDIFTMGARCLASMDSLRFGPLDEPRNRFLVEGVVAGIASYGNCIGVPTVGGEMFFDECYNGNPLVNVFNLGIAPGDQIFLGRAGGVGNPVIYAGSKTGRDGIHGATMASEEFDDTSDERRPTVQVGDPFTEKLLMEACLELFKTDYVIGIQDMGAAGLTCSTCEMASRGDTGVEIDLARVPQREEGMMSYELMLSESQERMLLVARKGTEDKVLEIFHKWDLEAEIVGVVTDDGMMRVRRGDDLVAEIPAHPLAEEGPVYERPYSRPEWLDERQLLDLGEVEVPGDCGEVLLRLLASPGIARKHWVWEQYDHMVRVNTVVLPGSDAAVIRVPGTEKGLAISSDCNPLHCYLDPRGGAMAAVAEAARNVVCSGGKPLAVTNCLNFGNPERPEIMWQFAEAVEGLAEACRALETPVTGGNVSFYNETLGEGVFPTPTIGMVGLLEDLSRHTTQWFKKEGDAVVLLGGNTGELGGSEYLRLIHGLKRGLPPRLDLDAEKRLQDLCLWAIGEGIVASAHDCSEGGLAVALAESCLSRPQGPVGARIELKDDLRSDALLFGEARSRIVLSLPSGDVDRLRKKGATRGVPLEVIGSVGGDRLAITAAKGGLDLELAKMDRAWRETFAEYFRK